MRFVKSAKLAAVALAAASGVALAIAPANAATTPLKSVSCDRSDTTQLQFEGFISAFPLGCYKGSGDLDVNVKNAMYGRAGDHSGYVLFEDGTKVSFTKGGHISPPAGWKTVVHIHTN
ncbi:hypothetical protein ACH4U6_10435 [Streptomyces netropsis]|uniref:hypothetical protein n=1 Tax=Streptomyces netropsis TaxID=55404 RepID=UPI00379C6CED